jgi:hypothetical protein
MSVFNAVPKNVNDDCVTPIEVWTNIEQYLPKDKIIWCPFFYNGEHKLKDLGYNIIHQDRDFFTSQPDDYDLIVDNPPFSKKKDILRRCLELDKPFILIMPTSTLCYQYFKIYKDNIQLIIPPKRYNFKPELKSSASFETLYFCYKMDLPQDIIFI